MIRIQVNSAPLERMARNLKTVFGELKGGKIMRAAIRDSLPGARKEAISRINDGPGQYKSGGIPANNGNVKWQMVGNGGQISAVSGWHSFVDRFDAQEVGGGVHNYKPHFGKRFFPNAFIAKGKNGREFIFVRKSKARKPLMSYRTLTMAQALHQHSTFDPVMDRFAERFSIRVDSQMSRMLAGK